MTPKKVKKFRFEKFLKVEKKEDHADFSWEVSGTLPQNSNKP